MIKLKDKFDRFKMVIRKIKKICTIENNKKYFDFQKKTKIFFRETIFLIGQFFYYLQ